MKLTVENIKKHYPILIIKLLIIALFIYTAIRGYNGINFYMDINGDTDSGLLNYFKIVTETTYYRPTLILLAPFIGVFINNKVGWILILSFFYLILSTFVFNAGFEGLYNSDILLLIFGMIIILLPIGLMNIKKVSYLTYGITKTELIGMNVIAWVIGISITIVLVLINANDIGIKYVL